MRSLILNEIIIFFLRDGFPDALGFQPEADPPLAETKAEREEVYAKGTAMPLLRLRACAKQIE